MTTGPSGAIEVVPSRNIEDLPVFTELDEPDFGADLDWVANDLFRREYQGLYRHHAYGVIAYRNADIAALGGDEAVSHAALVANDEGVWDRFAKATTFLMRPPEHRPAKSILNRELSAKSIHRFADVADTVARDALKAVEGREAFDLVTEFVLPMLARFWEEVLGLQRMETGRIAAIVPATMRALRVSPTQEDLDVSTAAANEFVDVMTTALEREIAEERHPILLDLMRDYAQMGALGRPDNIATHFGAALADGFNTAGGLAANAVTSLVSSPEALAAVHANPALIENAFQEGTRMSPVVLGTSRSALHDLTFDGVFIPADTPITLMWAYGNRDPEVFAEPNEYWLTRENHARQTTFGIGFYACPGRHTAKLIAKTVMSVLCAPALEATLLENPVVMKGTLVREPERIMMSLRRRVA